MPNCRDCGNLFSLYKGKPGYVNQCGPCGERTEDESGEERLGGNMIYLHKTGGQIEVKPLRKAKIFAAQTRRLGAGVTASLTQSRLAAEKQIEGDNTRFSAEYRGMNK